MRPPPPRWFGDAVTVATCTGRGSLGPVLNAPVPLQANVSEDSDLIRATNGDVVTAVNVMRFQPTDEASITLDSVVTFDGTPSKVIKVRTYRTFGRLVYVEATTQ